MQKPIVGLFGTCGNSCWREAFIERYNGAGIEFFNPQLPSGQWSPEFAKVEAHHLATDGIVAFPVLGSTYGTGSLAETGFSILNALRLDSARDIVILIEDELDPHLKDENPTAYKESMRARALISAHLNTLKLKNVYVVNTLEEMLEVTVTLYRIAEMRQKIEKYN